MNKKRICGISLLRTTTIKKKRDAALKRIKEVMNDGLVDLLLTIPSKEHEMPQTVDVFYSMVEPNRIYVQDVDYFVSSFIAPRIIIMHRAAAMYS